MKTITTIFAAALLAGTSGAALAATPDARLQSLQDQIQTLAKQLQDLKADAAKQQEAVEAQQAAAKKSQAEAQAQQAEFKKQQATAAKATIANGRLSVASADGNFTAAVRGLLQVDTGYYMQQGSAMSLPTAYGPDLSSGTNLRRVFLGLQGKVFGDWAYYFLYDFGGATTETPGKILYAYLQYDGLAPWSFRVGAYPAPINIEDSTTSGDLIFFERNSPSNLQRNIAGAEGRDGISVLYTGERIFGALSLTGNKISDGTKAYAAAGATPVPNYDEQTAVSGRFSYMPVSTADAHWIVGANALTVFNLPNLVPNGSASLATVPGATAKGSYSFADLPEFSVDSNGVQLVSTGALSASHVSSWGLETAGNYQNFYGQAGYYGFYVHRSPIAYNVYSAANTFAAAPVQPSNNSFSGWYVQASYILTGENRVYNPATASFTAPKPAKPLSIKDGTWGAFEFAARFSDLNLNDHKDDASNVVTNWTSASRTYTYYNTVRGGDQKILTLGVNWYPNAAVRISADYQYIDVKRLQSPAAVTTAATPALPALNGGQKLSTVALRFQLSL
jgi:phosphate-selective porin OprO/OprP